MGKMIARTNIRDALAGVLYFYTERDFPSTRADAMVDFHDSLKSLDFVVDRLLTGELRTVGVVPWLQQ